MAIPVCILELMKHFNSLISDPIIRIRRGLHFNYSSPKVAD
jgi:hypothetical protein